MKTLHLWMIAWAASVSAQEIIPDRTVSDTLANHKGALVIIDCSSGVISDSRPETSSERFAPCSTFKIWNMLIGLEAGIITSGNEPFYHWDGITRSVADWNRDLTLKEAFRVSCVPAFQNLARQIGAERMQLWLDRLDYGDRDISAGIDVFWLPAKDRKPILISPMEQAQLMAQLATDRLPFSRKSLAELKDIMTVRKTDRGTLYGKTGSGTDDQGVFNLGWFVGYVESNQKTYAFACCMQGENVMSKDARAIVETVFEKQELL